MMLQSCEIKPRLIYDAVTSDVYLNTRLYFFIESKTLNICYSQVDGIY